MGHKDEISTLNRLIEACRVGEKSFEQAAQQIEDFHMRTLFLRYAEQRLQFVLQLQQEVSKMGGTPPEAEALKSTAHGIAGGGEHAIVAECERGENITKDAYTEALGKELTPEVRALIERQYMQVKDAHDTIRGLEVKLS